MTVSPLKWRGRGRHNNALADALGFERLNVSTRGNELGGVAGMRKYTVQLSSRE